MVRVYLFDWGDTLMVDFPEATGKMRGWERVEPVSGAEEVLSRLSASCKVYIATSAADSGEDDIRAAFERVGLSSFISGYFCKANLGMAKGSKEFYRAIISRLGCRSDEAVMVGDSLEKDVIPAAQAGLNAVLFAPGAEDGQASGRYRVIRDLRELI